MSSIPVHPIITERRNQSSSQTVDALFIMLAALLIFISFFISVYNIERESLWYDEGWTTWAIHDQVESPNSIGETVQYVRDSLTNMMERIRGDVHPPLYYALLDIWTLLVGDSVLMVRLFSTLVALTGLAATYAIGRMLFDRYTGLMAVVILGTAGFFVYYTREARMYSLLLSLAALSMWAFLRWLQRTSKVRVGVYALLMAGLLYTHYFGALVIMTQAVYLAVIWVVCWRIKRMQRAASLPQDKNECSSIPKWHQIFLPYFGALVLFAPWIPPLIDQMAWHPNGPLAIPLPTDWGTVAALWLIVTSAHWGLFVAPFVLGRAVFVMVRDKRAQYGVSLLVLWVLLTPVFILTLNVWVAPLYQMRYTIAILPAGALLAAYALRHVGDFSFVKPVVRIGLAMFLLLWMTYTQLAMFSQFWPEKPRWWEGFYQMVEARQPLEPAIVHIAPHSVEGYYSRQFGVRQGISLDILWRDHTPEEVRELVAVFDNAPSVWAVLPSNVPQTWDVITALSDGREVGYRDTVMNIIFYRFDRDEGERVDWQFRFGEMVHYGGGIGRQIYAKVGETFCYDVPLTALEDIDGSYSMGLHMTQGYDVMNTQWDGGLGVHEAGEAFMISPCIDIPPDIERGIYQLRLNVYDWRTVTRLYVVEGLDDKNLFWGYDIVLGNVVVDESD